LTAYADTSFLASLYLLDVNSASAAARMKVVSLPLLTTPLGELELANAFALRVFRKELSASQMKSVHALFRNDVASGVIRIAPLGTGAFERAMRIARTQTPLIGTRTVDVLHVASALVLQADTFCTFDQRQGSLASAEGLRLC
jgi:predicted nucleic acid-binding protein